MSHLKQECIPAGQTPLSWADTSLADIHPLPPGHSVCCSVHLMGAGVCPGGVSAQERGFCPSGGGEGVCLPGVCLPARGVSVCQGVSACQGGVCLPGGVYQGGVSAWGVSAQGSVCRGVSAWGGGGYRQTLV